jgi:hypothetical protein
MSSLKLFAVESKIEELKVDKERLNKKLKALDSDSSEEEIAEAVADYLTGDIDYDELDDEFQDISDKLLSLVDIQESLKEGKELDSMQEAFLKSIAL